MLPEIGKVTIPQAVSAVATLDGDEVEFVNGESLQYRKR